VFDFRLGWSAFAATALWLPGLFFNSCVQQRSPQQMQVTPGWLSFQSERIWNSLSLSWTSKIQLKREQVRLLLLEYEKRHQLKEELLEPAKTEIATQGTYGQLPEVYVDQDRGAVFPFPIAKPNRFSWYQTALGARDLLERLDLLEQRISGYNDPKVSVEKWKQHFESFAFDWNQINTLFISLAQQVRYLSAWLPLLIKEQNETAQRGESPESEILVKSIFQGSSTEIDSLRRLFRPRRIVKQPFLPEQLKDVPAGVISVPIFTDIHDRKFLAEIEGSLMTHWNQSFWATEAQISFHIYWQFLKPNATFAAKKETLAQHLSHFPKNSAIITTGGTSTHVKGSALILGPGKVTPRTLAHEFGHLLGFNDCYLRTLTGQGIFGLAVLEWDNPFYPDDIMCDNTYGEPRTESW
jgi:hypothetical protein